MNNRSVVVVTPIYEDIEASKMLFNDIAKEFDKKEVCIVAVDDGSVNSPVETSLIESAGLSGVVIKLKKNIGHQKAIAIGLHYTDHNIEKFDSVVVMDSDGEDIPRSIDQLLDKLNVKGVDVVVAKRRKRIESFKFKVFYVVYKWIFKLLAGRKIDFGNFMALKPASVKRLVSMPELWIHVAACVVISKLRSSSSVIDRGKRYAGSSKMNFVNLALHGFRALMVYAEDVLVRVGIACAFVATLSVLGTIIALTLKILGFATPGWFSIALGILFLVFIQTGTLTLMTLMLTGVVKNSTSPSIKYLEFVDTVSHTNSK